MTHEELEAKVIQLAVQGRAMREIVARLLAHIAGMNDNPDTILKEFSNAGDVRLDRHPPAENNLLAIIEAARREIDWIVEAARTIIATPS